METKSYSLDLWDILRERLDECAQYKPGFNISNDLLRRWLSDGILSEEERGIVEMFVQSRSLEIFLQSKEQLVLPEDAVQQ